MAHDPSHDRARPPPARPGGTLILALAGRAKGPDKGITDEVLDLAEQLG